MRIVVLGRAQPAGSKRAFSNPKTGKIIVTDDAKQSRPWKQQVAGAARDAVGDRPPLDGPLRLDVVFVVGRPKGHYGSGSNSRRVRPSAPEFPAVKPDVTKLVRAIEDAMTGIVYRDDALIVEQWARKVYGWPERVEIHLYAWSADLSHGGSA